MPQRHQQGHLIGSTKHTGRYVRSFYCVRASAPKFLNKEGNLTIQIAYLKKRRTCCFAEKISSRILVPSYTCVEARLTRQIFVTIILNTKSQFRNSAPTPFDECTMAKTKKTMANPYSKKRPALGDVTNSKSSTSSTRNSTRIAIR